MTETTAKYRSDIYGGVIKISNRIVFLYNFDNKKILLGKIGRKWKQDLFFYIQLHLGKFFFLIVEKINFRKKNEF